MKFVHIIKEGSRHITTILFIGGFVFDLLILPEAGHVATIWIGCIYLGIVGAAIALREWVISRNTATPREQKLFSALTFVIAYFSGSALSFVFVYAIRSATFSVSWPLFVILLLCILANELISSHQFRLTLDVAVLLIATLFFVVFNMPVLLSVQNDMTFLVSLIVATGISLLYVHGLQHTSTSAEDESPRLFALAFGIPMFLGMLYFLNVIPAVPLVLTEAAVYHEVTRQDDNTFRASYENDTRLFSKFRTPVYHMSEKDMGVYFFSAITAPALLTAPISHVWEYYDETTHTWKESATVSFTLAGGRDNGYRAYSLKEHVTSGLWRVVVKVDDKRIVGRVTFLVEKGESVLTEKSL